jgi:Mrp family chromosome partitioning ATPase
MTATDRAFIRAYGVDAAEIAPPAPHFDCRIARAAPPAMVGEETAPDVAKVEDNSTDDFSQRVGTQPIRPDGLYGDRRVGQTTIGNQRVTTYVPPPHFQIDIKTVAAASSEAGVQNPPAGRKPLSSFLTQSPGGSNFEAALGVPAFHWPAECDMLADCLSGPLDQLVRQLPAPDSPFAPVIAITSLRRKEGRTTTALTLARRAAQLGLCVALVDGDLRRPTVAQRLGVAAQQGWEQVLAGSLPIAEAAIYSTGDNLTLVPAVTTTDGDALRAGIPCRVPLEVLRRNHDLVLLDAGPLLEDADETCELLESLGDAESVVLYDGRTARQDDLQTAITGLRNLRISVLGVVENFVPAQSTSHTTPALRMRA